MADTDLSDWFPIADAAARIGCSTRTVERLAAARKLEQRLRPQAGSPAVAVYNPEDVARIRSERQPAPAPFVLPAVPTSANGNGHGSSAALAKVHHGNAVSEEALMRGLAVLISKALQSPPSPPVSETLAETRLFLTLTEAAAVSGLPAIDLRRAIESGELKARKTGRGGWRIHRDELQAFR